MFNNKNIKPMLLREIKKPFNDNNYLYELKYDGYRVIIYVSKNEFEIRSRNNIDVTNLYPELENIKKLVGNKKVIFDGEIVAMENGKPSFSKLQARSHLKDKNKIKSIANDSPVTFIVFDILYQDKELINEELVKRKAILEKYKDTNYFVKSKIFNNGIELFKKIKELDLEGIVAKDKHSLYIPNKRVSSWIKIKNFKKGKFFIHGIIFNKEKYSLLLGEYRNKKLYFIGKVSIMPNNLLLKKLLKLKKCENVFVNHKEKAEYIVPLEKVEVSFIERTLNGILREPFISSKKA